MNEKYTQNNLEKFYEKALYTFITDMNQYDKDHNAGTWLGRGMAGMFMSAMDEKTKGTEDEENLTIDDLKNRHNPTLKKLGLNLESPNKEGNIDENETYAIGSIKINLEDKTKYLSFLKSLDKDKITETQKKVLEMTVEKIIDQVQNEYKFEEADERLLELFSGMREIVSEYERLGMSEKVNDFKDYLEHANSGYLREYILAKNKRIFRPIGEGFALSTFQRDASYKNYLGYWDMFLFETLDEIKKNENAKEFYNSVLKYAKDCIAFAEHDPKLAEYEANDQKDYVDGVRRAINEVKNRLEGISDL